MYFSNQLICTYINTPRQWQWQDGADNENRIRIPSLEGWCSTNELYPHIAQIIKSILVRYVIHNLLRFTLRNKTTTSDQILLRSLQDAGILHLSV